MNGTPEINAEKISPRRIKAVTFDVGGTLIEPWPSVGHVYAEVAARHGIKTFSPEQLNARFKTAWRARENFNHSREEWTELVNEAFREPNSPPTAVTFFPELYDRFAQPDAWRVFEDVEPTLQALAAKGIRLGIISNWDERLRVLLPRLKLDRFFETFTISCEVGFPKPSPVIFRQAAADLDLWPQAILHVGDSQEMDIAGAEAAGFHALQIHREHGAAREGEMHSLTGLPDKIQQFL